MKLFLLLLLLRCLYRRNLLENRLSRIQRQKCCCRLQEMRWSILHNSPGLHCWSSIVVASSSSWILIWWEILSKRICELVRHSVWTAFERMWRRWSLELRKHLQMHCICAWYSRIASWFVVDSKLLLLRYPRDLFCSCWTSYWIKLPYQKSWISTYG